MAEFVDEDLSGSRFERVDLSGSEFVKVNLAGASINGAFLAGARLRGAELFDVRIDGAIEGLVINGVEVLPLIVAELDRRDPGRLAMRPTDADGHRAAWAIIEQRWDVTVATARTLDPDLLHASVDGEWSLIETLRHLLFATDSWHRRVIRGEPAPWHPLDLPFDELPDTPGVPRDRAARPTLDEIVALRADRMAGVRDLLAALTDEQLTSPTVPVDAPGWPEPNAYPLKDVLGVLLNEEYVHRDFAERDLHQLITTG